MNTYGYFGYDNSSRYLDEDGKPVSKTPHTHPYSYDPYIVFGKPNKEVEKGYINGCVYDDRMLQSNFKKYEFLRGNILKNSPFETCSKENLEKFLSAFNDNKIKVDLVRILKGCNVSNGYPYYVFQYHYEEI